MLTNILWQIYNLSFRVCPVPGPNVGRPSRAGHYLGGHQGLKPLAKSSSPFGTEFRVSLRDRILCVPMGKNHNAAL